MANPHLPAGTPEPYRFDVDVHLETGIALKELASPSHEIDGRATRRRPPRRREAGGAGRRQPRLRAALPAGRRQDRDAACCSGRARGAAARESFFALMMEPPQRPTAAADPAARVHLPARRVGLDARLPARHRQGADAQPARAAAPDRHFNVVLFSGAAHVMSPQRVGAGDARRTSRAAIADVDRAAAGGGGTELMGGLRAQLRDPAGDSAGISRTVVVVTDGYVGVEAQAFRFIRERLDEANLFAFGIGSSVNRGADRGDGAGRAGRAVRRARAPRRRRPRPRSCARTSSSRCWPA